MFNYLFDKGVAAISWVFNGLPYLILILIVTFFLVMGGSYHVAESVDNYVRPQLVELGLLGGGSK